MPLEILSVNQNNGCSDAIAARQERYETYVLGSLSRKSVKFEVSSTGKLSVNFHHATSTSTKISEFSFDGFDIDGMIEFLQQSKQFIDEEKVYRKLIGKK